MKKKILVFLSYLLVAAVSVAGTLFVLVGRGDSSKLTQLEALIVERFIGDADQTAMEDAAAEAMVDSLGDRWSYYLSADDYESHLEQVNNSYVGIGVTITACDDGFEITKVESGGPAENAGIVAGDVITAIDGQSTVEMATSDARDLVRGEEGTSVVLTLRRESGEALDIEVTRASIQTAVATAKMLSDNIGLVTIANFDARCYDETIEAIESLQEQGAEALIFDVRNNPGGYASELVKVLDYLLPEGPLFRSEDYQGNMSVDESDANFLDMPMAVLVNGSSYSAAEFFAAALSEYEAATVVGEQTSGKGYFQQTFRFSDGSAVGLSVGKYYTPNGVSLADAGGITPDIIVEVDDETAAEIYAGTIAPEDDPQLQAAIDVLTAD